MRNCKRGGRALHYHSVLTESGDEIGILVECSNPPNVGSAAGDDYEMARGIGQRGDFMFGHGEEYTHRC